MNDIYRLNCLPEQYILCELNQHTTITVGLFLERGICFNHKTTCIELSVQSSMKKFQRGSYIQRYLKILKPPPSHRCNSSRSCCYVHVVHINTHSNFLHYIYVCKSSSYRIHGKVLQPPTSWSDARFTALKFMWMPPKERYLGEKLAITLTPNSWSYQIKMCSFNVFKSKI